MLGNAIVIITSYEPQPCRLPDCFGIRFPLCTIGRGATGNDPRARGDLETRGWESVSAAPRQFQFAKSLERTGLVVQLEGRSRL